MGHPGFITTITSASTSLNYHWEVTWHMTLFCFFWHRFRGHGADSPLTMFTFTWHLSLSHRRRWKPAHAHWLLGLQLESSGYNVQDHWSLFTLLHWTGWQQNSSVRTQNAVTDCTVYSTVQCTGVQCSLLLVYSGHLVTARCTGMRSPHYGFVCKHRQGLLCMFS